MYIAHQSNKTDKRHPSGDIINLSVDEGSHSPPLSFFFFVCVCVRWKKEFRVSHCKKIRSEHVVDNYVRTTEAQWIPNCELVAFNDEPIDE
jgi:hypothetical protein